MLTGKCKNDFNNWYANKYSTNNKLEGIKIKHIHNLNSVKAFNVIPFSMQYGVYVDFFDEHDIYCEIICMAEGWQSELWLRESDRVVSNWCEHLDKSTRNEARQKAIEKANEIYNLNE